MGVVARSPHQFVVGDAVSFALAGFAVTADPQLVELSHERPDDVDLVGEDSRLEIATVLGLRSHAGSR